MREIQFYQSYGKNIHAAQNNPNMRTLRRWPYLAPVGSDHKIPVDARIAGKFLFNGFSYPGYLSAVMYRPGFITYMVLPAQHYAAVSYEFSGCFMARFRFKGVRYVCHISTAGSDSPQDDCKQVWMDFLHIHADQISELVMFRPTDERKCYEFYQELKIKSIFQKQQTHPSLCGLIKSDGSCHSLVLNLETCCIQWPGYYLPCRKRLLALPGDMAALRVRFGF